MIKNELSRCIVVLNHQTLKELYTSRLPLYQKHAYFTIDLSQAEKPEAIISAIKQRFFN